MNSKNEFAKTAAWAYPPPMFLSPQKTLQICCCCMCCAGVSSGGARRLDL